MLTCWVRKSWGARGRGWDPRAQACHPTPPHPATGEVSQELVRLLQPEATYLLLLAMDADQPSLQVVAGEPGLDPLLGFLSEVIALVLEGDPVLWARVARGTCGGTWRGAVWARVGRSVPSGVHLLSPQLATHPEPGK